MVYDDSTFWTIGSRMNLDEYFAATKPRERKILADACGTSVGYLYHCAKGRRHAGPELCKLLVKHEPRLTLAELRPDIWGDGVDSMAASDDTQPQGGTSERNIKEMRAVA